MSMGRIDFSSDISILLSQLRRLAASRLGKRLGVGELVLVEPRLAQVIVDMDSAISTWLEDVAEEEGVDPEELRELWRSLRERIIRKAAIVEIRRLSEPTRIFVAASNEEREEE